MSTNENQDSGNLTTNFKTTPFEVASLAIQLAGFYKVAQPMYFTAIKTLERATKFIEADDTCIDFMTADELMVYACEESTSEPLEGPWWNEILESKGKWTQTAKNGVPHIKFPIKKSQALAWLVKPRPAARKDILEAAGITEDSENKHPIRSLEEFRLLAEALEPHLEASMCRERDSGLTHPVVNGDKGQFTKAATCKDRRTGRVMKIKTRNDLGQIPKKCDE